MERSDKSDWMDNYRDICSSLLMLFLGLFFCFLLATLIYFTYQTIAGSWQFCTLWIDVPGRIILLLIFYYIASICGFLPLPQRYQLHSFIAPFNAWRLRSWSRLFRNMSFIIPTCTLITRLRRNVVTSIQENLETPLLQENNKERPYTCSPRRRCTTPINIPYPEAYIPRVSISNPETTSRNEIPEIIRSLNGSITSIDPSLGDIVLPIMPEKSSKRHYISEATIKKSETPSDRDKALLKYRKRHTEIKLPGEAAENALASLPDYHATTRGSPVIQLSDNKSEAVTDDERLAISRGQECRRLRAEIPEMHIKKDVESVLDAKTHATDLPVANEHFLDEKYFDLAHEERLVATRQPVLRMSRNEISKVDTTDDSLQVLERNEILQKTNDHPLVKKNQHPGGAATCSDKRSASPKYCNTKLQLNISGARKKNRKPRAIEPAVARERPLNDKYFEVTDEENLATAMQKELQMSGNKRPKVLSRTDLLPRTNEQPTIHRRNVYPGETCSPQRGVPLKYCSTKAHLKFSDAHNRNQQPQGVTVNKEREISLKLHSTEAQINFPETLSRNRQPDRETASSERERVARTRNDKTSLSFPLFPWIILRNSKGLSARSKELLKKHLEFVKCEMAKYPVTRNRGQVYLDRSLARCLLRSLHSQGVIQTQLPKSHENINSVSRSSFRTENNSSGSAKSSDKRIEGKPNASSGVSEGNVDLTTNRYGATKKQGRTSMCLNHAMNLRRSLIDRATRRRRQPPSLRFHAYTRTRSQIQVKTEVKRSAKLEKDCAHIMAVETGTSNLSPFEEAERTGIVKPETQETAKESFNRSQLEDLRKNLTTLSQNVNIEASAAVESKEGICAKTADKNNEDICESSVSIKPTEAEVAKKQYVNIIIDSPLITSESDSDSDTERAKE